MSKPSAISPQTALAEVERRIVAAAKERAESATEPGSRALTDRR